MTRLRPLAEYVCSPPVFIFQVGDHMRIYLSDNATAGYSGPVFQADLFSEWVPKGCFFKDNKTTLDIDRGVGKVSELVRRHSITGRTPVVFDVEGESPETLRQIAHAVTTEFPMLRYGFYCKTSPDPKPPDPAWNVLEPYIAFAVSQGWQNRRNVDQWIKSVELQSKRWRATYPALPLVIAMAPRAHPNVMRRGWYSGLVPTAELKMMIAAARKHFDFCVLMTQREKWARTTPWYECFAEADPRLKRHGKYYFG